MQPDSITPNLYNPQSWNKYAYAGNNPINFTDPTGHEICTDDGYCGDIGGAQYWHSTVRAFETLYGISFNGKWKNKDKIAVMIAVMDVGSAFGEETNLGASDAFKSIYGNVNFEWCDNCVSNGYGWTYDDQTIKFDTMYDDFSIASRLVTHELGHLFDRQVCAMRSGGNCSDYNLYNNSARKDLGNAMGKYYCQGTYKCLERQSHNDPFGGYWGFAGAFEVWQFGAVLENDSGEPFADMFVGWVYDSWDTNTDFGNTRRSYMNARMAEYLNSELLPVSTSY